MVRRKELDAPERWKEFLIVAIEFENDGKSIVCASNLTYNGIFCGKFTYVCKFLLNLKIYSLIEGHFTKINRSFISLHALVFPTS